jgi:hypothetical protein
MRNVLIGLVLIAAVFGILVFTMNISYNNSDKRFRNLAEAQRGNIESVYDKMWKVLQQKAQITDEYKNAFAEIYPKLIDGRYQGDATLLKFVQENNPNFDVSLYEDLMRSVEVERNYFAEEQKKMLDVIREHQNLLQTIPSSWFINNKTPIEYTVISSTIAKEVMQSGIDDNINLFKKEK